MTFRSVVVFSNLGYQVKPPTTIGFKNRNVHFAGACRPEAKARLSPALRPLLEDALPDNAGMVRICTEPPGKPKMWRTMDERWLDVPAAAAGYDSNLQVEDDVNENDEDDDSHMTITNPPLVVKKNTKFAAHGPGVVSKRTAEHVGFNGLQFRGKQAFPELSCDDSNIVAAAWPKGLLCAGQPGFECESLRCAPENWIARRPVSHFARGGQIIARYPLVIC